MLGCVSDWQKTRLATAATRGIQSVPNSDWSLWYGVQIQTTRRRSLWRFRHQPLQLDHRGSRKKCKKRWVFAATGFLVANNSPSGAATICVSGGKKNEIKKTKQADCKQLSTGWSNGGIKASTASDPWWHSAWQHSLSCDIASVYHTSNVTKKNVSSHLVLKFSFKLLTFVFNMKADVPLVRPLPPL